MTLEKAWVSRTHHEGTQAVGLETSLALRRIMVLSSIKSITIRRSRLATELPGTRLVCSWQWVLRSRKQFSPLRFFFVAKIKLFVAFSLRRTTAPPRDSLDFGV